MTEIKLTKRVKYAGDVFKELTEKAGFPIDLAADFLNNIPDADAVPAVHGRWIEHPDDRCSLFNGWECSECKQIVSGGKGNYCPNCGAKMDGGAEK